MKQCSPHVGRQIRRTSNAQHQAGAGPNELLDRLTHISNNTAGIIQSCQSLCCAFTCWSIWRWRHVLAVSRTCWSCAWPRWLGTPSRTRSNAGSKTCACRRFRCLRACVSASPKTRQRHVYCERQVHHASGCPSTDSGEGMMPPNDQVARIHRQSRGRSSQR